MTHQQYLDLEDASASYYSTGIVRNEETVARVLFSPKHYEDGKILPVAFEQIFNPNGMSVLRQDDYFETSLTRTIEILQKDDENEYFGYVCASVLEIRSIVHNNYRVFYVRDTATEDRISHADVFSIRLSEMGAGKAWLNNYIRFEIANVFNRIVSAS